MDLDLRLLTGFGFYIVGAAAVYLSVKLWWTHPINRVFFLGPFITKEGMKALLRHNILLFALGLFAIASGAARQAYWARWHGYISGDFANFFGSVEFLFAFWAAGCIVWAACRLWRGGSE